MLGRLELMMVLYISEDISFRRHDGIWSGPIALCTSNVVKSCGTPSQFIAIGDMSEKGGPCIGGGGAALSYVNMM